MDPLERILRMGKSYLDSLPEQLGNNRKMGPHSCSSCSYSCLEVPLKYSRCGFDAKGLCMIRCAVKMTSRVREEFQMSINYQKPVNVVVGARLKCQINFSYVFKNKKFDIQWVVCGFQDHHDLEIDVKHGFHIFRILFGSAYQIFQ